MPVKITLKILYHGVYAISIKKKITINQRFYTPITFEMRDHAILKVFKKIYWVKKKNQWNLPNSRLQTRVVKLLFFLLRPLLSIFRKLRNDVSLFHIINIYVLKFVCFSGCHFVLFWLRRCSGYLLLSVFFQYKHAMFCFFVYSGVTKGDLRRP